MFESLQLYDFVVDVFVDNVVFDVLVVIDGGDDGDDFDVIFIVVYEDDSHF